MAKSEQVGSQIIYKRFHETEYWVRTRNSRRKQNYYIVNKCQNLEHRLFHRHRRSATRKRLWFELGNWTAPWSHNESRHWLLGFHYWTCSWSLLRLLCNNGARKALSRSRLDVPERIQFDHFRGAFQARHASSLQLLPLPLHALGLFGLAGGCRARIGEKLQKAGLASLRTSFSVSAKVGLFANFARPWIQVAHAESNAGLAEYFSHLNSFDNNFDHFGQNLQKVSRKEKHFLKLSHEVPLSCLLASFKLNTGHFGHIRKCKSWRVKFVGYCRLCHAFARPIYGFHGLACI